MRMTIREDRRIIRTKPKISQEMENYHSAEDVTYYLFKEKATELQNDCACVRCHDNRVNFGSKVVL